MVYATGSNAARTRRYQIGINKFLNEIEKIFYVFGRINKQWEPFQKNVNYDAFFIVRREKEYVILEEQTESYMNTSPKKKEGKKHIYNDRTVDGPELVDVNTSALVLKKRELMRKVLEESPITEEFLKKHGLL